MERSFRYFSQRTVFQKCSWPIDKQQIKFTGGTNYHSKNHSDFSRGANYHSKIRGESSSKAHYHSKNRADQNNRCHENAGKFRQNIVSSEISSKSHEKPGILSKFVFITFAQYCSFSEAREKFFSSIGENTLNNSLEYLHVETLVCNDEERIFSKNNFHTKLVMSG